MKHIYVRPLHHHCRQEHDRKTLQRQIFDGRIDFEPTYNAAPSQLLPIITTYAPTEIVLAKWGFVPENWTSAHIRAQNNARLETAAREADVSRQLYGPALHGARRQLL